MVCRILYAGAIAGLCVLAVPAEALAKAKAHAPAAVTDHSEAALVGAAAILLVLTAVLYLLGGSTTIAKHTLTRTLAGADPQTVEAGATFDLASFPGPEPGTTWNTPADYVNQRGRYLRGLFIGADNRWSTSKLQAGLWTYAVLFGLLSLLLADALGNHQGFAAQLKLGLQDQYLILLGGPFAAAVLAKYITTSQVSDGSVAKPPAPTSTIAPNQAIGEVVGNDAGGGDLGDAQYFAFNLVALAYFYGEFCWHLQRGFPNLPDLLVGLTGLSASTYVAKKALADATPTITSVVPTSVHHAGGHIDVYGQNLVVAPATTPPPDDWGPLVTLGGKKVLAAHVKVIGSGQTGVDRVRLTIPEQDEPPPAGITLALCVYTAIGTQATPAQSLTITR
jgi:hypothetical protein